MRKLRIALIILSVVLLAAIGGFVFWAYTPPAPTQAALTALESGANVTVRSEGWIEFMPATPPTTGFIFYPGGRVDARAYAAPLRQIAEAGYLAVIAPMPLNLAIFGLNRADEVTAAYPEIEHWVIGGHSLGGAMAGRYAFANGDVIDGIVLWASFVEPDFSLADRSIAAASVYGTLDGLATVSDVNESRAALPATAAFVEIAGGNHAQFGDYGPQGGDNDATISAQEQQAQAVDATLSVLAEASS